MKKIRETMMERLTFSVGLLKDESEEIAYWRSRSPEERLIAVELYRQMLYGYDPATTRMQKILEIDKRKSG